MTLALPVAQAGTEKPLGFAVNHDSAVVRPTINKGE